MANNKKKNWYRMIKDDNYSVLYFLSAILKTEKVFVATL
jgi:hypothetical protein